MSQAPLENSQNADYWQTLKKRFLYARPPTRVSNEDLSNYEDFVKKQMRATGTAVILGSTPTLRVLLSKYFRRVIVIDFSQEMVQMTSELLPPQVLAKEEYVFSDWLTMRHKVSEGIADVVVGDSVFKQINTAEWPEFAKNVSHMLHSYGCFISRIRSQNFKWLQYTVRDIAEEYVADMKAEKYDARGAFIFRMYDKLADKNGMVNIGPKFPTAINGSAIESKDLQSMANLWTAYHHSEVQFSHAPKRQLRSAIEGHLYISEEKRAADYSDSNFFPVIAFRKILAQRQSYYNPRFRIIPDGVCRSILKGDGVLNSEYIATKKQHPRIGDAYRQLMTEAMRRSCHYPKEVIREIQEVRLWKMCVEAAARFPAWKERLAPILALREKKEIFAALAQVPITNKALMRRPEFRPTITDSIAWSVIPIGTSGSTGEPFLMWHDLFHAINTPACVQRIFDMAGGQPGDLFIRFASYDYPFPSGYVFVRCPRLEDVASQFGRFLGDLNGRTCVFYAPASYLLEIARLYEQGPMPHVFRAVIAGSETITEGERAIVERALRAKVYTSYAARELGRVAMQCSEGNMHANSEAYYVEVVDDYGTPVPAGKEGKMIVTSFINRLMPLIRYDTGDIGSLHKNPCRCGRTTPTFTFVGRSIGVIPRADGTLIHHFDINRVIVTKRMFDISRVQIILETPTELTVLIVPVVEIFPADIAEIQQDVVKLTGSEMNVRVEVVSAIPVEGVKRRMFISRLESSNALSRL